ncbi:hypothetical protein [Halopseudomonas xinjiangensis]|uniref:hypothetical protein n=1 Tax=Halopseudomonas xinjiangensis TaxID=487184 RepID=UPI0012FD9382|nr:hypothetical protein [Halopseudomonas xinjiangensis]
MNRSSPASDNLFLRSYASLKGKSVRLTGTLVLLAVLPLVAVLALSLGLGYVKLKQDIASQTDAVGQELARQVAASVAEPMAANDNLSLNIILAQWDQNPLIEHAAVYTLDNRVVAEAGQRTAQDRLAPGEGRFTSAIHYQDAVTGQLHLGLAAEPFSGPARDLLRLLLLSIFGVALIAGLVAWRLALRLRRVLVALGNWQGDSGQEVPGSQRKDEIGDLARRLGERRIVDMPVPETPEPVESPIDELDSATISPVPMPAEPADLETTEPEQPPTHAVVADDEEGEDSKPSEVDDEIAPEQADTVHTVVAERAESEEPQSRSPVNSLLAVRLGNLEGLRRLPRPRLMTLLERYRLQVRQASEIYDADLTVLDDGTSVLAFQPDEAADSEELTRALSCGELLRVLGHELQVGISDTGINLYLQLAMGQSEQTPTDSEAGNAEADADGHSARMLELLQFSRNLLLLDASLAGQTPTRDRAVIRKLASQPGTYCVERLNEPYQTLLERNLNQLYSQRSD